MTYMLDGSTVLALISGNAPGLRSRLEAAAGDLVMSALTAAELEDVIARCDSTEALRPIVNQVLSLVQVLGWPTDALPIYARLQRFSGPAQAVVDMRVAAHAVAIGATLIAHATPCVKSLGLTIEDWTAI